MSVENPMVMKNGYGIKDPQDEDHLIGTDATGDEVFKGDYILELDGEIILEENVIDFLVDILGAKRKIAGEKE